MQSPIPKTSLLRGTMNNRQICYWQLIMHHSLSQPATGNYGEIHHVIHEKKYLTEQQKSINKKHITKVIHNRRPTIVELKSGIGFPCV